MFSSENAVWISTGLCGQKAVGELLAVFEPTINVQVSVITYLTIDVPAKSPFQGPPVGKVFERTSTQEQYNES